MSMMSMTKKHANLLDFTSFMNQKAELTFYRQFRLFYALFLLRCDSLDQDFCPFCCIWKQFCVYLRLRNSFYHCLKIEDQELIRIFQIHFSFFPPSMEKIKHDTETFLRIRIHRVRKFFFLFCIVCHQIDIKLFVHSIEITDFVFTHGNQCFFKWKIFRNQRFRFLPKSFINAKILHKSALPCCQNI